QGGDNLLPYRRPLTPTFDDLQIGAACRGLPAEIHGGESRDDSIVVRTPSPCTHTKSTEQCIDRGTTLSQPPPIAINNINDLDAATPRNCRRSVSLLRRELRRPRPRAGRSGRPVRTA